MILCTETFQFSKKTLELSVLMEGCNCKIQEKKWTIVLCCIFIDYTPSQKGPHLMTCEQIEKFECLKSSTTPVLSHGIFRIYMARVTCPETCLKVCQL